MRSREDVRVAMAAGVAEAARPMVHLLRAARATPLEAERKAIHLRRAALPLLRRRVLLRVLARGKAAEASPRVAKGTAAAEVMVAAAVARVAKAVGSVEKAADDAAGTVRHSRRQVV